MIMVLKKDENKNIYTKWLNILFIIMLFTVLYIISICNNVNEINKNQIKFDSEIGFSILYPSNVPLPIYKKENLMLYFIDKNKNVINIKNVKTNNKENIHYILSKNTITFLPINRSYDTTVYLDNGQTIHLTNININRKFEEKKYIYEISINDNSRFLYMYELELNKITNKKLNNQFQLLESKYLDKLFHTAVFFFICFLLCIILLSKKHNRRQDKLNYGLNTEQIEFLKHLTYLDKNERFKALSNIEFNSRNLKEFSEKLDFELTLFNKVYNEKSKFYKDIFDSNDFGNICFIINNQYDVTYKHKKQADIILEQQQNFDCLMDEIKNVSPVQYEKSLTINIDEFFGEKEMVDIPFIQYTDLSDHINNNQKIINELKNIRFDCVFQ